MSVTIDPGSFIGGFVVGALAVVFAILVCWFIAEH